MRKQYEAMRAQYFSLTKHGQVFNRFQAQSDQLNTITRIGIESHNTSQAIVERMKAQTNTVVRVSDDMKGTNTQIHKGDKLINSMSWNDYCYRLGLHILAFVLFVLIILMVINKLL